MTDDLQSIRRWLEEFSEAVRAVDFDRGRTLVAPEVVGFGTYAEMLVGVDSLVAGQWQNIWGGIRGFRFRLDELHWWVDGDLACVAVLWDSEGQSSDGVWFERPGRATFILSRQANGWRAVHTHLSLQPKPQG